MNTLQQAALPLNDEDWGSDRQIEAQNAFMTFAERVIKHQPNGEQKWTEFEGFCLKATTEEMINEAVRLMKPTDSRDPDWAG